MEHTISILASKKYENTGNILDLSIYWDDEQGYLSFPSEGNSPKRMDVSLNEISEIVTPTEDNVKLYDASWDYHDLTAYTPTTAGVLFGVFGLIGESVIKGHPVHFIICMKSGTNIFCKMKSKGYDKFEENIAKNSISKKPNGL
jgi:hypothetical protein